MAVNLANDADLLPCPYYKPPIHLTVESKQNGYEYLTMWTCIVMLDREVVS